MTLLSPIIAIAQDAYQSIFSLLWLDVLVVFFIVVTFLPSRTLSWLPTWGNPKTAISTLRIYLVYFLTAILVVTIYWIVNHHFVILPDPVLIYIFFTLISTIRFGVKPALYLSLTVLLLTAYYVYTPGNFYFTTAASPIILALTGLGISLVVGGEIRDYEKKLIAASQELRMALKLRESFASIAAHDLRNPITVIKLYTELLRTSAPSREENEAAATAIVSESNKLVSIIDSMLDFAKIENQNYTLKKESFDLVELCQERVSAVRIEHTSHMFTFTPKIESAIIHADRIAIDRVITNLLSNAAKYSKPSSVVELTLEGTGPYRIHVTDNGVGIQSEYLDKIFEPFYQAPESRRGLGLGLHIVKSIVTYHKGAVRVVSEINKGSTFSIELPASA